MILAASDFFSSSLIIALHFDTTNFWNSFALRIINLEIYIIDELMILK